VGGEDIATETITIEETDDLTAAEAEALMGSVWKQARFQHSPLLIRHCDRPPGYATRASRHSRPFGLGELRLPLDEVLQLLTSKVLWQEFFSGCMRGTGSLDAAQPSLPKMWRLPSSPPIPSTPP